MSEEYEIIFITEEGRAIKNNKTGKIYHSEFEIIEEKNKEINRLNNIINELEKDINEKINVCRKCQIASFKAHDNYNAYNGELLAYESILDKLKALKGEQVNMSEEEIKELIEQVGYKEFYRYYEEKDKLIEDLQQKVKQLENIRKEAIEYVRKHSNNLIEYLDVFEIKELDNILNKGSDK